MNCSSYTDDAPSNQPQPTIDAVTTEPQQAAIPDDVPAPTHDDAVPHGGGDVQMTTNGDDANGSEAYEGGYGGQHLARPDDEDEDAPIGIKEDG